MKNGCRPTRIDHRDYDFIKSHKLGATLAQFQDEYLADANLTMPDQETADTEFTPPTPPMPYGCTDFAQADLATDLTKQIHNPNYLESMTHANEDGGCDIRTSLNAAVQMGWFKQYFNVTTSGLLDYFDSFRLAQLMGVNAGENRSITWGTPWFSSWEQAAIAGQKVMPMPTDDELAAIRKNSNAFNWHDSKLDGWTSINGVLVYRDKSWQGTTIGFLYFPREVINMVMSLNGTAAFIPTLTPVTNPVTISLNTLQWILSVVQNMLYHYL